MSDPTEDIRRAMIPEMPDECIRRIERGERVWDTEALRDEFEVVGFAAPFVIARKRDTGERGSLMFTHHPRYYFGFEPDA